MKVPILVGPLRGWWWLPSSRGKVLRVLLGTYEPEQTREFLARVGNQDVVFDIGAHAGYYTLLAAAAGCRAVWAFEPDSRNRGALQRHVEANGLANVRVQSMAVADRSGVARFSPGSGSGTGKLIDGVGNDVATVSVDEFCRDRGVTPTVLKVDVEGAEARVLEGARRVLAEGRPTIFLSTHGSDVQAQCLRILDDLGYTVRAIDAASTELLALPQDDRVGEG